MPLPWLARGLSLVIAAKSAVRSSTPTVGVPDELVVVVLPLDDDFELPPHAAITKSAMARAAGRTSLGSGGGGNRTRVRCRTG